MHPFRTIEVDRVTVIGGEYPLKAGYHVEMTFIATGSRRVEAFHALAAAHNKKGGPTRMYVVEEGSDTVLYERPTLRAEFHRWWKELFGKSNRPISRRPA